jgi:hypothetical protein
VLFSFDVQPVADNLSFSQQETRFSGNKRIVQYLIHIVYVGAATVMSNESGRSRKEFDMRLFGRKGLILRAGSLPSVKVKYKRLT